jgi:energy-coupling factor transport system permease protein
VALSVAPQLVESVQRVRRARRLRGAGGRGVQALRAIAVPVLHDALERSLRLAAGMDSRGYGRTGGASRGSRRLTAALMLGGLAGLCLGSYGLLGAGLPGGVGAGGFAGGVAACVAGLMLGGRRVSRTRYRPDPWRWPEWAVAACGVASAVVLSVHLGYDPAALNPDLYPLQWPPLPLLPAAAILVAALAAVAAPPPPSAVTGSETRTPAPELTRARAAAAGVADSGMAGSGVAGSGVAGSGAGR